MSRSLACTVHLWPPPGHGQTVRKLAGRLTGARAWLTGQLERGGSGPAPSRETS